MKSLGFIGIIATVSFGIILLIGEGQDEEGLLPNSVEMQSTIQVNVESKTNKESKKPRLSLASDDLTNLAAVRVMDSNSVPIENAIVVFVSPKGKQWRATSDARGVALIHSEIKNEHHARVYVGHSDYGSIVSLLDKMGIQDGAEIQLQNGAIVEVAVGSSNGKPKRDLKIVVMSSTSRPLAIAPIVCELSAGANATETSASTITPWPITDNHGKATLRGLPAGSYTISAFENGRLGASIAADLKVGLNEIRMTIPKRTDISTRVLNDSGAPIAGARTWLFAREKNEIHRLARSISGVDGVTNFSGILNSDNLEVWAEKNDHWGKTAGRTPQDVSSVVISLANSGSVVTAVSVDGDDLLIRVVRATIDGSEDFIYEVTSLEAGKKSVILPFVFPEMNYSLRVRVAPETAVGFRKSNVEVFHGSEPTHTVVFEKTTKGLGRGSIRLRFDGDLKNEKMSLSVQGYRCSLEKDILLTGETIVFHDIFQGPKTLIMTHPTRGAFVSQCEVPPDGIVEIDVKFEQGIVGSFELPDTAPTRAGLSAPWSWCLITEVVPNGGAIVVAQGFGGNGQGVETMAPIGRLNNIVFVDRVDRERYLSYDFDSTIGFNRSSSKLSSRVLKIAIDTQVLDAAEFLHLRYLGGFLLTLKVKANREIVTFNGVPPGAFTIVAVKKGGEVVSSAKISVPWRSDWSGTLRLERR